MSYNGSGVYTLPGAQLVNGAVVSATEINEFRNDVASALNTAWTRDGQAPATDDIPMGNNKLTGLAVATNTGDALSYGNDATVSDLIVNGDFSATGDGTIGGALSIDEITSSTNLSFTGDGNFGVGTSNPLQKLEVAGAIKTTSTSSNVSEASLQLDYDGSNGRISTYKSDGSYLEFWTTTAGGVHAETVRINPGGSLLVGTTVTGLGRLTAVSNSSTIIPFYAKAGVSGDLGQPPIQVDKYDNNTTTSQVFQRFSVNNNSTANGQINANGSGAVAFGSWSDRRLKENIVDIPSQLANVCALRPVEFDYIQSEGGGHQIGFVAQEMQEVYPDAVGERSDGMLSVTGWSKTEARLVKAIQELKSELDKVKAELATLKGA